MPYATISELLKALEEEDARTDGRILAAEANLTRLKSESGRVKGKLEAVRSTKKMMEAGSFQEPTALQNITEFVNGVGEIGRTIVDGVKGLGIVPIQTNPVLEPRPSAVELQTAYDKSPREFTIREVLAGLDGKFNEEIARSSASNFLRRKEDTKEIEVVERGQGRRPSLYRKLLTAEGYDVDPDEDNQFSEGGPMMDDP